jgi:hypothetical protein
MTFAIDTLLYPLESPSLRQVELKGVAHLFASWDFPEAAYAASRPPSRIAQAETARTQHEI